MTKIAIISQPEQGVLIDVGGCSSLQEATQHLTYTLQVSSQFWEDQPVDLSLGNLSLAQEELAQIFATLNEVAVHPRHIYAQAPATKAALRTFNVVPAAGAPASLPSEAHSESAATTCGGGESAAQTQLGALSIAQTVPCPSPTTADVHSLAATAGACLADSTAGLVQYPASDQQISHSQLDRATIPVEVEGTISGALPEAPDVATPAQIQIDTQASPGAAVGAEHGAAPAFSNEFPAPGVAQSTQESAPASAAAPDKEHSRPAAPHIMYLRQTLRSGQAISHKGHLVIVGDVNPGAEVIAEGDITVWGALRGIAHAGVGGNLQAEIRALRFDPIQLRIAHAIARSPDRPRGGQKSNGPETARIVNGAIRIAACAPE